MREAQNGHGKLRAGWIGCALLVGLHIVQPAVAIDFELDLAGSTGLNEDDHVGWEMLVVVRQAANHWEDIFDGVSQNYHVKCEFTDKASRAGEFEVNRQIGGTYKIKFYVDFDAEGLDLYYFDESPEDHSEFDLQQLVYGDVGSGFSGTPENYLEVSYSGSATIESGISGQIDLYTQALRALAGVMGFRQQTIGRSLAEQHLHDHGYYSIDDDFNAGDSVGVGDCDPTAEPGDLVVCPTGTICWIDLCADSLLVDESFDVGKRHLPSATDALVVAAINEWEPADVRLPRVDMLPNTAISDPDGVYTSTYDWHDSDNWIGGRVPQSFSEAYLRESLGEVWLEANAGAGGLHVFDDNALLTNGNDLGIVGPLGVYDADSAVYIQSGDTASAELLTVQAGLVQLSADARLSLSGTTRRADRRSYGQIIEDGELTVWSGELDMRRGILDVDDGVLELIEDGVVKVAELTIARQDSTVGGTLGVVRGNGTIRDIEILENNGVIESVSALHLVAPGGYFDLDGEEPEIGPTPFGTGPTGEILATEGSLRIEGSTGGDEFDGMMTVAGPYTVEFTEPWVIGAYGEVNLQTNATSGSTSGGSPDVTAPTTTVRGKISSSAAMAEFTSDTLLFDDGAQLGIAGALALKGTLRYIGTGAVYEGSGAVYQCGDATVHTDTIIGVARYIWDGEGWFGGCGGGDTTIHDNVELTFTGNISGTGGDGYDRTVSVLEGAKLSMTQDWQLDGTIQLQGGTVSTGDGAGRLTVASGGLITGRGVIESNIHLDHGATLEGTGSGIQVCGNVTGPGTTSGTVTTGGC